MAETATQPQVPELTLAPASADEYCRSLLATPGAEMWWFQTGLAPYAGFSRPFRDYDGRWWWRPKPQFAWPLDYYQPFASRPRLPRRCCLLGYQYPVAPQHANSLVHFNVILDLAGYGLERISSEKRRAVRKGLRELELVRIDPRDPLVAEEARIVWNSHVERTGWNRVFAPRRFVSHWQVLSDHAGTIVLGVRQRQGTSSSTASGHLCAWLIGRLVEGCAYVDTIASHTERLESRPNDTLIFVFLFNAARAGLHYANYFLRSSLAPLERFKQSLGFDSSGLPSRLCVNPLVAAGVRLLLPGSWRRLRGDWPPPAPA